MGARIELLQGIRLLEKAASRVRGRQSLRITGGEEEEGRRRERGRSSSRSESREKTDDAELEKKQRRQARDGIHREVVAGSRHQTSHWSNQAERRKEDSRDRGPWKNHCLVACVLDRRT